MEPLAGQERPADDVPLVTDRDPHPPQRRPAEAMVRPGVVGNGPKQVSAVAAATVVRVNRQVEQLNDAVATGRPGGVADRLNVVAHL